MVTRNDIPAPPRRRWPLLAIGASAGTATWSGWVGLGQLTGFGVVHPLPGIANGFTINTAVTLPIGVEAYAMYALSIATSSRPLPDRTRRYAWASSAAALLLGMAGQVAYHVMTARHPAATTGPVELAPWWVIALVSCLPVLVLGAASLLWHLAGSSDTDPIQSPPDADPISVTLGDPPPSYDAEPLDSTAARSVSGDPTDPAHAAAGAAGGGRGVVQARPVDLARVRAAIDAGDLAARPAASAIRALLAISPAYARAARDALTGLEAQNTEASSDSTEQDQEHDSSPTPTPHQPAEESPEHPSQQHIPAVTKKQELPKQPLTTEIPIQNDEEIHTYASLIE